MKLQEPRESYYYNTGKLGEIVRQLDFAGIAVVWMFRSTSQTGHTDDRLIYPLALHVTYLGLDLLQYIYASAAWGLFTDLRDREGYKNDDEIERPHRAINWPTNIFLWGKSIVCVIAFGILAVCLWNRV